MGAKSRMSTPTLTMYETPFSPTRRANSHCACSWAISTSWLWWKSIVAPDWWSPSRTVPMPNSPVLTPSGVIPRKHVMDNKISTAMKDLIKDKYKITLKLVPPGCH
ncbi:hypothetical protein ACHAW6_015627 [Cyclotella cf. meneghiniana]